MASFAVRSSCLAAALFPSVLWALSEAFAEACQLTMRRRTARAGAGKLPRYALSSSATSQVSLLPAQQLSLPNACHFLLFAFHEQLSLPFSASLRRISA